MKYSRLACRLLSALSMALVFIFATSCSKDEATIRKITIDGTSYSLSRGYISDLGSAEDDNGDLARRYTVILTSKGLTMEANGEPIGKGELVYVTLFSTSDTELATGTYTVNFIDNLIGTLTYSQLTVNFVVSSITYDAAFYISAGTVKVSKSGSRYTLELTGTVVNIDTQEEVSISAFYEGKLAVIDIAA